MGEWRAARIGDLGRVVTGATPRAGDSDSWDTGSWDTGSRAGTVDFLTPTDQRSGMRSAQTARRLSDVGAQRLASRVVPPGAACVTCIGATVGKTSLTVRPTVTNQQINSVVPDEGVARAGFLYYLLTACGPRLARVAGGSATPIVTKRQFENVVVRVPGLAQQEAIGSVLGALDDKIAASDAAARTALDLAEARFDELLSRGERGQSASARSCRLGDLAELRYGRALPASARLPGDVPVYGSAGIVGTHSRALVAGPGIVIGRKGTAGSVHWAQRDFFPIDTTFYVALRAGLADLPLEFLFFALERLGLAAMGADSAVPGLSRSAALTSRILVPGAAALRAFRREVRELFALRESLAGESAQLARVRDALIPHLVTGRISVSLRCCARRAPGGQRRGSSCVDRQAGLDGFLGGRQDGRGAHGPATGMLSGRRWGARGSPGRSVA